MSIYFNITLYNISNNSKSRIVIQGLIIVIVLNSKRYM